MDDLTQWIASGATMIAAMMTAANLGTRVTGWGFVLFTVGSAAWATLGLMNGPTSLVITNGVLLVVNLFGVWRWLGRQSRYEDSRERAAARSRRARVPTLFSAGALIGAAVKSPAGETYGTVVEAMLNCDDKSLAYVVTTEGGIGGAGEVLRAIPPEHLRLEEESVLCDLSESQWRALPPIENDRWPAATPRRASPQGA
jgi:hypothetical protein